MIAAGIVLYNPDINLLLRNIESIYNQVDYLILIDNGSDQELINSIRLKINLYKNIIFIFNGTNKGIAFALNRIIEICCNHEIDWVITLDQDSICPSNIISAYSKYIEYKDVAIITCAINYNNGQEITKHETKEYDYIDWCITSAAFTKVDICAKLGGFDESMFIDYVDFDYCIRVRESGYRILKTYNVILQHQLGELKVYKFAGKVIHVGNHNSIRKYYWVRNVIYTARKHKNYLPQRVCVFKVLACIFKVLCFERKKFEKIHHILRGIVDGVKMSISSDMWININL